MNELPQCPWPRCHKCCCMSYGGEAQSQQQAFYLYVWYALYFRQDRRDVCASLYELDRSQQAYSMPVSLQSCVADVDVLSCDATVQCTVSWTCACNLCKHYRVTRSLFLYFIRSWVSKLLLNQFNILCLFIEYKKKTLDRLGVEQFWVVRFASKEECSARSESACA